MLALLFLACPANPDLDTTPADTDSGTDSGIDSGDSDTSDTDTSEDTDTGGDGLRDVRDEMARNADACAIIGGHDDVSAAQQYYWGEFLGDEATGWTGDEAWYLYGNEAWYARGLEDCEIWFTVTAEAASTGACTGCDVGLIAEAVLDTDRTTCPASQYEGFAMMTEPYAVELLGDGSVDWYFPDLGSYFGRGYWDASGMNYLADDGCTLPVD